MVELYQPRGYCTINKRMRLHIENAPTERQYPNFVYLWFTKDFTANYFVLLLGFYTERAVQEQFGKLLIEMHHVNRVA